MPVPRTATAAECLGQLRVNDLVRVNIAGRPAWGRGEAAEEVHTRVEDVIERCSEHGRRYVIAAPRYSGDVELPERGTTCTLEWPGPHGIWVLPVRFLDEEPAREGLRVWVVEVIALPRQNERRLFCRVNWEVPVTIMGLALDDLRRGASSAAGPTMVSDSPPAAITGRTRNISEGGVRCLAPGPALPVGLGVIVELDLSGEVFALSGRVQWVRPTGMHPLAFDLAITFDDPGRHGDRMRPLLFAEQLRLRRAGLE